jgi:hypothetical protein
MGRSYRIFLKNFFRRETVLRAIRVALVVGPILIIINHHDALLKFEFNDDLYFKFVLTFFVPYCVSAYSSAQAYCAEDLKLSESTRSL